MNKLEDLEMVIDALPEEEYAELRRWFLQRDWAKWDRQIEADSASGRLDFLAQEARADDLTRFRLPEGVQHRLDSLLDRQDQGTPLSADERSEAEGLVNLADLLSVLRLRAERLAT